MDAPLIVPVQVEAGAVVRRKARRRRLYGTGLTLAWTLRLRPHHLGEASPPRRGLTRLGSLRHHYAPRRLRGVFSTPSRLKQNHTFSKLAIAMGKERNLDASEATSRVARCTLSIILRGTVQPPETTRSHRQKGK